MGNRLGAYHSAEHPIAQAGLRVVRTVRRAVTVQVIHELESSRMVGERTTEGADPLGRQVRKFPSEFMWQIIEVVPLPDHP